MQLIDFNGQEANAIRTYDIVLNKELHMIGAHQLHYSSLIEDVRKTVEFIRDAKNPAMESFSDAIRKQSESLMERECKNLLNEIDRLENARLMQEQRLNSIAELVNFVVHPVAFLRH